MEVNMTKIMLVEDDKSLREIYGVRLLAEGYEIISAGDGEEALAMAVKEKPDLILSDVMMPKISGFDMLDILRSTPETKDVKVIMMTALSSEDQRARGESLGANRYLVKSQVGIEDVVRTVHDILADVPIAAAPKIERFGVPAQTAAINQPVSVAPRPVVQNTAPVVTAAPVAQPAPVTQPVVPVAPIAPPTPPIEPIAEPPISTPPPTPPIEAVAQPSPTPEPVKPTISESPVVPNPEPPIKPPVYPTPTPPVSVSVAPDVQPTQTPPPPAPTPVELPQPTAPFSTAAPASLGDRVINPITPISPAPDMTSLMNHELNDGSDTSPIKLQP